ncbi:MAG: MBL fold metallo-hydrolase [Syntrophales bacterium]|jgi:glyoxylase-like metal-dependent hydrolase (beta-lactamase superfamily II)
MFARQIRLAGIVLLILFMGQTGAYSATQDFTNVQIQTEKVADNVFMLIGAGGNIGVSAGKDCVFMIDTSYAPLADKIKAAIAAVSGKPIQYVVNTHWHQDHVGGNENFAKAGATVVAHENVRKRVSTEQFVKLLNKTVPPLPESALPVITFSRNVTFYLNGNEIFIFHIARAHTDGDAIVHFKKSNVIHMGDIYFNGMYPFIDLSAGGSINGMIEAVKRILLLCDQNTKVMPGHGHLSNKAELEEYLKMLVAVRDRIAREIKAGKPIDAVIASQPTRDLDPVWGKGFMKPELFVKIVYESLASEKSH